MHCHHVSDNKKSLSTNSNSFVSTYFQFRRISQFKFVGIEKIISANFNLALTPRSTDVIDAVSDTKLPAKTAIVSILAWHLCGLHLNYTNAYSGFLKWL
jgi:hypothetical protein